MKTPLRVFAAIFLALFAVSSIALIGGGIIQHNHSSTASGGNTLAPATLSATGKISALNFAAGTNPATIGQFLLPNSGIISGRNAANNGNIVALRFTTGDKINIDEGGTGVIFAGTVTSTAPCATGYVRTSPNFCRVITLNTGASQTWIDAAPCTQRTFPAGFILPADATQVLIHITWQSLSNNLVAQRLNTVNFFDDTGCAVNLIQASQFRTREFVATVAGTILDEAGEDLLVTLCATNTICALQANAGGNGNAHILDYSPLGYFD